MTKQKFLYQLGMCIRKYRQLAGMSQEKLGSVIHYDKNTIGKIERGETDLKISTLLSISSGLNTSCFRILKEADTFPWILTTQQKNMITCVFTNTAESCRRSSSILYVMRHISTQKITKNN